MAMDFGRHSKNRPFTIPIVRFFEFLGFFIAFCLLYVFFSRFNLNDILIASLAFIISLSIIKTDLMIYSLRNLNEVLTICWKLVLIPFKAIFRGLRGILSAFKQVILTIKRYFHMLLSIRNLGITNQVKLTFTELLSSVRNWSLRNLYPSVKHRISRLCKKIYRIIIYGMILLKQVFFNVSYDIFPMLLIWLSILGTALLFGWPGIKMETNFINSIVAFSILLGIFQYFLKRHEEKIFSKIAHIQTRINKIVTDECSFENFYRTAADNILLRDFINSTVDPKLTGIDFFKMAFRDEEFRKIYYKYHKDKRPIPIHLGVNSSLTSDQKYALLELSAEDPSVSYKKELLSKAYHEFFLDIADREITERIYKEIDVQEFGILAISNISIVQEVLPDFINVKLQNAIGNLHSEAEIEPSIPEPISQLYQQFLHEKVNTQLQRDILH